MPFYIPLNKVFDIDEFVKLTKYLSKIKYKKTSVVKRNAIEKTRFWPFRVKTLLEFLESFDKGVGESLVKIFSKKKERDEAYKMFMVLYIMDYISYHIPTFEKTDDFHFIILTNIDEYKKYNISKIGRSKLYFESADETLEQVNEFYAQIKSLLLLANFILKLRAFENVSDLTAKLYLRLFTFKHRKNFFENELNERDFHFLKNATVEFKPTDYIEQISDNTTYKVNYFIEHLDINLVTYLKNRGNVTIGYSINNLEAKYGSSFLEIWTKVNSLQQLVTSKELEYQRYSIDIFDLYGKKLLNKLNDFVEGETNNFLFICMENDFLLDEFKGYLYKYHKLPFMYIAAESIIDYDKKLPENSIIRISNKITERQYTKLLDKIEEIRNKGSIKIIFYSSIIPKTKRYVSFINPNSTLVFDNKMEINSSKLFHAILCKYSPEATQLQCQILQLIENNKFAELITDDKLDYRALDYSISQLRKINFDYLSPISWYHFNENYIEHCDMQNHITTDLSSIQVINITLISGGSATIKSDDLNIDIKTDLEFIKYFCIIYKHTKGSHSPISYTKLQLIHLYKQYLNCDDISKKENLKEGITKRLENKNSFSKTDHESFRSVSNTFQNKFKDEAKYFQDFLDKKSVKGKIQLSNKTKQRYDFDIEGLVIEDFWFEEYYEEKLRNI